MDTNEGLVHLLRGAFQIGQFVCRMCYFQGLVLHILVKSENYMHQLG